MRCARFASHVLSTLLFAGVAHAAPAANAPAPAAPAPATAILSGGCFWSMESAFEGKPGVLSVVSGFTGGHVKSPSYEEVSTGGTGHAESIKITYDPRMTSYAKLLDNYWHNIDPMQADGQFYDHGDEYRTVIYYANDAERSVAENSMRAVASQLRKPIATRIEPIGPFYAAEDYHQDFYKKSSVHYHAYRLASGRDIRLKEIWGKAPKIAH